MIDGKPFQLSVMRYAAVGTNAVDKLNASHRFGSICDALVSGSPSPNYTIKLCICTASDPNSGILCRSIMVRDNLCKTNVGQGRSQGGGHDAVAPPFDPNVLIK